MRKLLLILSLIAGCQPAPALGWDDEQLAQAIYLAEGGKMTKYPYGIKSIDTHGDEKLAKRICLNTIRNSRKRWEKAGMPGDEIHFLALRYCPPSAHLLNRNWEKNVRSLLEE